MCDIFEKVKNTWHPSIIGKMAFLGGIFLVSYDAHITMDKCIFCSM
jgi:hypothetical protein